MYSLISLSYVTLVMLNQLIIIQLVILTLLLLLVNDDQYCDNLLKQYHAFKSKCSQANITIDNYCMILGRHNANIILEHYQSIAVLYCFFGSHL